MKRTSIVGAIACLISLAWTPPVSAAAVQYGQATLPWLTISASARVAKHKVSAATRAAWRAGDDRRRMTNDEWIIEEFYHLIFGLFVQQLQIRLSIFNDLRVLQLSIINHRSSIIDRRSSFFIRHSSIAFRHHSSWLVFMIAAAIFFPVLVFTRLMTLVSQRFGGTYPRSERLFNSSIKAR